MKKAGVMKRDVVEIEPAKRETNGAGEISGGSVRGCEQRFFSVKGAFLQLTLPNFKQQCCQGDGPELSIVLPREPT
jgi:hypothetical protein